MNELRAKFRVTAKLRKAESQVKALEKLIAGGDSSAADTIKSLDVYRKKVAESIEIGLTTEAAKVDINEMAFRKVERTLNDLKDFANSSVTYGRPSPQELLDVQNKIDAVNAQLASRWNFVTDLQTTLRKLATNIKGDRKDPKELKWTESQLVAELQDKKGEIDSLKAKIKDLREARVRDTGGQDDLEEAERVQRLKAEKLQRKLEEALARENKYKEELEEQNSAQNSAVWNLGQAEMVDKIELLELEVKNYQKAIKLREYQIEQSKSTLENTSQRLVILESQQDKTREAAMAEGATEDPQKLRVDVSNLEAKVADLRLQLEDKNRRIDDYKRNVDEGIEEADQTAQKILQSELKAAKKLVEQLKKEACENTDTINKLREQKDRLEQELSKVKSALRKAELALLDQPPHSPPQKPGPKSGDLSKCHEKVRQLEQELELVRQELELARKENIRVWEESNRTNNELATLTKQKRGYYSDATFLQARYSTLEEKYLTQRRQHTKDKVELDTLRDKERRRSSSVSSRVTPWLKEALVKRAAEKAGQGDQTGTQAGTPSSPPSPPQPRKLMCLQDAARLVSLLETDPEDAAPCGEDGALRTKLARDDEMVEMSPEFVDSFHQVNLFLNRRNEVSEALRKKDLEGAETQLDKLSGWLRQSRITTTDPWTDNFMYLEVDGSLDILRARIDLVKAQNFHGLEEEHADMLKSISSLVENVLNKHQEHLAARRGARPGREPSQWERLADYVLHAVKKMKERPVPSNPVCHCEFLSKPCDLHDGRYGDEKTSFYHLVEIEADQPPELYLEPEMADALRTATSRPTNRKKGKKSPQRKHFKGLRRNQRGHHDKLGKEYKNGKWR